MLRFEIKPLTSKWLAAGRQRHGHALRYISIYGDVGYLGKKLFPQIAHVTIDGNILKCV